MTASDDHGAKHQAREIEPAAEFASGSRVGVVNFDIDYAIIKHFSEHLYSSPNKAIEELVSNGFDALATTCYVYVPGDNAGERVVVWDNGMSMDSKAIEAMWMIARSPKEELGPDRIVEADGRRRAAIGKFGIGKLASYAVGDRISHLTKTPTGEYFSVSVNYRTFTDRDDTDSATGSSTRQLAAPIKQLTEAEARGVIDEILPSGDARSHMFDEPHWTLAVIDDLKDARLYPGRLSWVLGNGMPLRPDFEVFVEDSKVEPRLETDAASTWTLGDANQKQALADAWAEAVGSGRVEGDLNLNPDPIPPAAKLDGDPDLDADCIVMPTLGRVSATIRVFERSLSAHAEDHGRSYGFFVSVRGRLVNPDDDKLLLNDPSFATFYRSQFTIRADGLDAELLADRESLRRDTTMTRELFVLQQALYRRARKVVEAADDQKERKAKPESRLPTRSRELFRDPMTALMVRRNGEVTPQDLDEPSISRSDLGQEKPLADIDAETGKFVVNRSHPFYREVEAQAGGGKKGQAILSAFDLIAISERLIEGFLFGRGVPDEQIRDLLEWRDALLRALAEGFSKNPEDAVLEVRAASVPGGERFEHAVAALLNLMGFVAVRDGASGKKDITVTAPVGPSHRIFTVEPKGSAEAVGNVTAAIASAAAHRDEVAGAVHAVVVAREFAGFKGKDEPAILKECQSTSGVSVMHVETLIKMYEALSLYAYPLETLMDAMFVVETPDQKDQRIAGLEAPLEGFNIRQLLDDIWERQQGESASDVVPVRTLWQSRAEWKDTMTFIDFTTRVLALDSLTGSILTYDQTEKTIYMAQSPEYVAAEVNRSLAKASQHGG